MLEHIFMSIINLQTQQIFYQFVKHVIEINNKIRCINGTTKSK